MPVFNNALAGAAGSGGADAGYQIERSIRLEGDDAAYLSRSTSNGSGTKWTVSFWTKNTTTYNTSYPCLFGANTFNSNRTFFRYTPNRQYEFFAGGTTNGSSNGYNRRNTVETFTDPSAWHHICLVWDTNNSVADDRCILYVNGKRTTWSGTFSAGATCGWNQNVINLIGKEGGYSRFYNGYIAEFHNVDGAALNCTDFGEFDDAGVWQPIEFEGDHNATTSVNYSSTSDITGASTLFDGDTGTYVASAMDSNYQVVTTTPITFVSGQFGYQTNNAGATGGTSYRYLRLTRASDNATTEVTATTNGTSVWTIPTAYRNTPISKIEWKRWTSYENVSAVYVDGNLIQDSTVTGVNGFYLDFSDPTSTSTLGTDRSGNNNNWSAHNLSVAAGVGNDSLFDSPTDGIQADTGLGGQLSSNYCTFNPLAAVTVGTANWQFKQGNLEVKNVTNVYGAVPGTIFAGSGKFYWEVSFSGTTNTYDYVGIMAHDHAEISFPGNFEGGLWYNQSGNKVSNADGWSGVSYGDSWNQNSIIGVALDLDNRTVTFYKDNVSQGVAFTNLSSDRLWGPAIGDYANSPTVNYIINTGSRPFQYQAPAGFKCLCTANLPTPTITDGSTVMDVVTYTGSSSTKVISNLNMSPDLVWLKTRTGHSSKNHTLFDTVRGVYKFLQSDTSNPENDSYTTNLTAFNSDGFTLGSEADVNSLGRTYVGWLFDGGTVGANEVGSYWSPSQYQTKYIGFKFPTSSGGRAVFGLISGTGTADIYTSSDNNSWTRVQENVTLSTTDTTYDSTSQYLLVVNTTDAVWGGRHYAMATNGTDGHYSTQTYPGSGASFTWSGPAYTDWDFRSSGTVIKPGSLNSSLYNQDQNWGPGSTITGSWAFSDSADNAFDGDLTTVSRAAASQATTINLPADVAFTSSVKLTGSVDNAGGQIYVKDGTNAFVNVSTGFNASSTVNTVDITSLLTSPIKEIKLDSVGGGYARMAGIEVDGKLLVSSSATPPNVPSSPSTCRTNQAAGFSIVSYHPNGDAQSIAHNLNKKPEMMLVKNISNTTGYNWYVYHKDLDPSIPQNKYLVLNDHASITDTANAWNDTAPTSSVFTVKGGSTAFQYDHHLAYVFTSIPSFSAFGKYRGNGANNGTFVFTNFTPRFLLTKPASSAGDWMIWDSEREPFNTNANTIQANTNNTEAGTSGYKVDFLSNGFKFRMAGSSSNYDGSDYVYACFASNPFKNARAF